MKICPLILACNTIAYISILIDHLNFNYHDLFKLLLVGIRKLQFCIFLYKYWYFSLKYQNNP